MRLLIAAMRKHLAGGKMILPAGTDLLWTHFCALAATRRAGDALSFSEIAAYSSLLPHPLRPEDVANLRSLDDAYLDWRKEAQPQVLVDAAGRTKLLPPRSAQNAVNAAAFDAVFG